MPRICEDEEDKKDQSSAARNKYKRNDSLRPPTNVIGRNVSAVQLKSLRLVLFNKEIIGVEIVFSLVSTDILAIYLK